MDAHVVLALRNKIIHKFCRTILWVDDEIDLLGGLGGENPLFRDKFDEFTREGLLCHLKGFPPVGEGSDPYFKDPVLENAKEHLREALKKFNSSIDTSGDAALVQSLVSNSSDKLSSDSTASASEINSVLDDFF